ncbi:MAG: MetQ/NlpA family ABC transporter substrate-binding protein [Chloroflexota bacterium]
MKRAPLTLLVLAMALSACGGAAQEPVTLRIGVLPILDALPMYVAREQGYFAERGVTVELIPVSSAAERDQLMQAGQIDGMINDLVSTLLYNQREVQILVVRFARVATPDFPQYRILAAADSVITSPQDLRQVPIGISQGTVIEYVTDRLLTAEGLAPEEITTVAVPSIADRMSLLSSGELEAATLPDPLSSLAIQAGARVIVDDTRHPEYGNSVYSFRREMVEQHPQAVRGFLQAVEQAVADINADKSRWQGLLTEQSLVPAPLVGSYELPDFPSASIPSPDQWADVLAWAQSKGLIEADVPYADSVTDAYLP